MSEQTYQRDEQGGIIDPPILSQHERAINDAAASGDERALARAQQKYHDEREQVVAEIEGAQDDEDDEGLRVVNDDNDDRDRDINDLVEQRSHTDLQAMARDRGLDTSGTKAALAERIVDHDEQED